MLQRVRTSLGCDDTIAMNRLSRLLAPTNVVIDLPVTSKKRLFEQVGLLFENNQGIERGKVFDALFARERLGSTGLGESVAIPHGRIKGLDEAVAAVVRLAEPLPFDAPDGKPVQLLVFLLVPEHGSGAAVPQPTTSASAPATCSKRKTRASSSTAAPA